MCKNKDGSILTAERDVIERWNKHFDEHLKGSKNAGNEGQSTEKNVFVSSADDENQLASTSREAKDSICLYRLIGTTWETELIPKE